MTMLKNYAFFFFNASPAQAYDFSHDALMSTQAGLPWYQARYWREHTDNHQNSLHSNLRSPGSPFKRQTKLSDNRPNIIPQKRARIGACGKASSRRPQPLLCSVVPVP